jgi:pimeloyl-ACP methyl ester carboxylesterase
MSFRPEGWHPNSRFLNLDGDRVHFVDTGGDGFPVLLLHGILVSSWAWRRNLKPLRAAGLRPIAVCQKGFGWSGKGPVNSIADLANFIRRFADALDLERFGIIGNSLGGSVAVRLAIEYPDRVSKLMLASPAVLPPGFIGPFLRLQTPRLSPVYRLAGRRFAYRWLLRRYAYRGLRIDDDYMHWFFGPLKGGAVERTAASVARALARDLPALFAQAPDLNQPILLVWGAHDGLLPLRAGHILERILPTSRLVVFPNAAHCPMEEEPARFNALATDFFTA